MQLLLPPQLKTVLRIDYDPACALYPNILYTTYMDVSHIPFVSCHILFFISSHCTEEVTYVGVQECIEFRGHSCSTVFSLRLLPDSNWWRVHPNDDGFPNQSHKAEKKFLLLFKHVYICTKRLPYLCYTISVVSYLWVIVRPFAQKQCTTINYTGVDKEFQQNTVILMDMTGSIISTKIYNTFCSTTIKLNSVPRSTWIIFKHDVWNNASLYLSRNLCWNWNQ